MLLFGKYVPLDTIIVPAGFLEKLRELEARGMMSPVLYGGALRDNITGHKSPADLDIQCAGVIDPDIQNKISILLANAPKKYPANASDYPIPDLELTSDIKTYFNDHLGIELRVIRYQKDKIKLCGLFHNAVEGVRDIDLSITRSSFGKSAGLIRELVLDDSDITASAIALTPDGQLCGHKLFEADARSNVFRPQKRMNYQDTAEYFEKMRAYFPDITFRHSTVSIAHQILRQNAPVIFKALKALRNHVMDIRRKLMSNQAPATQYNDYEIT
jgi:hypothetical protein